MLPTSNDARRENRPGIPGRSPTTPEFDLLQSQRDREFTHGKVVAVTLSAMQRNLARLPFALLLFLSACGAAPMKPVPLGIPVNGLDVPASHRAAVTARW